MNVFKSIYSWLGEVARVFSRELTTIFHDTGVLIFFFVLPLAYPIVYTLIYNPEVVREIPVAVVDHSCTPQSREFIRMADAAPAINIVSRCANMADAKALMASEEVFGILELPSDYAKSLAQGQPAVVQFYGEMSLLIRYRSFVAALSDLQMALAQKITFERAADMGVETSGLPIQSRSNFLGDIEQGFASFVIPGIIILILQQSMLLGIAMLGGTSRERRRSNGGIDPLEVRAGACATVIGRAVCYVFLYIPCTLYILNFIPWVFNLPHVGDAVQTFLFVFPLLVASAFMGQALTPLIKERESAFVLLVFTSVLFLFLSGLTWPRYAMNDLWIWLGNCVPATWCVEGFVRINSNGATIGECAADYRMMWLLAAIYFIVACIATKLLHRRHQS
jgi:ABC-2 type transport system permease protein